MSSILGGIPFTPFQPHLQVQDGRSVPLSECDEQQCEQLRQQLIEKFQIALRMGKSHLCQQIDAMMRSISDRVEVLEDIREKTPVKKVDPFEKLKIMDTDD